MELFAAYIEALRQVAAQRVAKAEAAVTQLLVKLNVGPQSSWDEVSSMREGRQGAALKNCPLHRAGTAHTTFRGHSRACVPCGDLCSVAVALRVSAGCSTLPDGGCLFVALLQVAPLLAAAPGCAIVPLDRRAELFDERVQEVRESGCLAEVV